MKWKRLVIAIVLGGALHANLLLDDISSQERALFFSENNQEPFIDFAKYEKMGIKLTPIGPAAASRPWDQIDDMKRQLEIDQQASARGRRESGFDYRRK